jgi:CDP-glucose 4,6-dehydratase
MEDVGMNGPVLVTGAYGLLGGWLTRALTAAGRPVVVIRRDRTPLSVMTVMDLEPRVTVVEGDITSAGFVQRLLAEYEIESVFHLAAQTLVPSANSNPISTFETNIRGTWLLLEACRVVGGVGSIVVAASDKAYGVHSDLPYRESHALTPLYPYDVSKAATDMIARSYWHTYGLPVAVTRFANIYGGGDFNASRLIPETVRAILAGRAPVIRSDGSPERDFLYVDDAVRAYLAIAAALSSESDPANAGHAVAGEAFNAGGGQPHRVLDVVTRLCDLGGGISPDVRGDGTPSGEIDRQWVDHRKLSALTGWEPQVELGEGLERTLAWYREFAPDW